MAYERRSFAGGAANTTLASGINGSTTSIPITDATGWPTGSAGDFFVVIDLGEATEEKVRIESRSGTTLTAVASVGRGADGTSGQTHDSGATIALCLAAVDLDEANAHIADTALDHHTQYYNEERLDEVIAGVGLLGITSYCPVSPDNHLISSTTFTDMDATNLAVGFTVPPSGNVLVKLSGLALLETAESYWWGLREGTTDLANPTRILTNTAAPSNDLAWRMTASIYITGLTPGEAKTYKWSHASDGGQAQTNSGGTGTISDGGPSVMEVWAAP